MPGKFNTENITLKAKRMCEEKGHTLAYLVKFGSHLYGTNTEDSDRDYRGIFIPSKESMLLKDTCKQLRWGTGDKDERNSKDDVDINIWSLHHFLKQVGKGEVNALDLLYSYSNKSCVLAAITNTHKLKFQGGGIDTISGNLHRIFENPLELFNPEDVDSYVGYCMNQAAKYGIKGSRLGVLKEVREKLDELEYHESAKLGSVSDEILDCCYDDSYCFQKEVDGTPSLIVCGKVHLLTISMEEFEGRIEREYNKYGDRSREAMEEGGIDWKALSHAMRALFQMKQLLKEGRITFPLQGWKREYVMHIKQGEMEFDRVEELITDELESVNMIRESEQEVCTGNRNSDFVRDIILSFYN